MEPSPAPIPEDVLIRILLELGLLELMACEQTCRQVYHLIQTNSSIRCLKKALSYGLRPTLTSLESSMDALISLEDRERGWRALHFEPLHPTSDKDPESDDYRVSPVVYQLALSGDYFYTNPIPYSEAPSTSSCILRGHIPSGTLEEAWMVLPFPETDMIDFLVDVEQDVFIWANYARNNTSSSRTIEVHCRSALSGQPHPGASSHMVMRLERDASLIHSPRLRGDHLCMIIDNYIPGEVSQCELIVVNWRTGVRKDASYRLPGSRSATRSEGAIFIDDHTLLLTSSATLQLLTFTPASHSLRCVAVLALSPDIIASDAYRGAGMLSRVRYEASFAVDDSGAKDATVVCGFAPEWSDTAQLSVLVLRLSTLLALSARLLASSALNPAEADADADAPTPAPAPQAQIPTPIAWSTWSVEMHAQVLAFPLSNGLSSHRNRLLLLPHSRADPGSEYDRRLTMYEFGRYAVHQLSEGTFSSSPDATERLTCEIFREWGGSQRESEQEGHRARTSIPYAKLQIPLPDFFQYKAIVFSDKYVVVYGHTTRAEKPSKTLIRVLRPTEKTRMGI